MDGFFSVLLKIVYFLIVFGIIVLLAYFTTKVIGKRVSLNTGKYMRIVDTLFMGNDRTLVIVQVQDEFLLMSCSVKGIEIVKKLDDFSEGMDEAQGTFDDYLKEYGVSKSSKPGIWGLLRKTIGGRDDNNDK